MDKVQLILEKVAASRWKREAWSSMSDSDFYQAGTNESIVRNANTTKNPGQGVRYQAATRGMLEQETKRRYNAQANKPSQGPGDMFKGDPITSAGAASSTNTGAPQGSPTSGGKPALGFLDKIKREGKGAWKLMKKHPAKAGIIGVGGLVAGSLLTNAMSD